MVRLVRLCTSTATMRLMEKIERKFNLGTNTFYELRDLIEGYERLACELARVGAAGKLTPQITLDILASCAIESPALKYVEESIVLSMITPK